MIVRDSCQPFSRGDYLKALPEEVDPCGESGEFHSFVFDGPMFNRPVEFTVVDTVERDGFICTDVAPMNP